ncbi:MAG: hypothetical protein RIS25_1054 [Actinomycetota bacterium]|jgi:hypothetical protein
MTTSLTSPLSVALTILLVLGLTPSVALQPARAETLQTSHPTISVNGRIIGSNSAPVAGVLVTISAWPSSETLTAIVEGERVPMIYLTSVKTDADGLFTATVELSTPDLVAMRDGGELNFQAKSIDGTAVYLAEFTTSDKAPNLQRKKVLTKNIGNLKPAGRISPAKASRAVGGCGFTYFIGDVGSSFATVGSTFVSATNATATFSFLKGASATLGIALKVGSVFSAGGTNSVSSSAEFRFDPNTGGAKNHQVSFVVSKYGIACSNTQELRAKTVSGGSRTLSTVFPSATFCEEFSAYQALTNSVASTNFAGFDVSSYVGFDLSSKSGFTTLSKLEFTRPTSVVKHLCGANALPFNGAGKIVVKN